MGTNSIRLAANEEQTNPDFLVISVFISKEGLTQLKGLGFREIAERIEARAFACSSFNPTIVAPARNVQSVM